MSITMVSGRFVSTTSQHTLGFEISVNESHEMQIFQRCRHFGGIKSGILFRNAFSRACLKSAEELATTAVFHAQV
jgi:hypothetical protein